MTRTLIAVRHAKSSWDTDAPDHDRPLSVRGRRDADAIGEWFADAGVSPDLVLCSTALRTRQTWAIAAETAALTTEVRFTSEIYGAWVSELVRLVRRTPPEIETLVLVGHAPGIPDLVGNLCAHTRSGHWKRLDDKFPTSGLARIDIRTSWADVVQHDAELVEFSIPRG